MEQSVHSARDRLCRFWLYQTLSKVYLVASDKNSDCWRLLKFDKQPDPANLGELDVTEDAAVYTKPQCSALLKKLNDGNLQHGGLQLVCQAYGILGCFRFMEGFYLLLVTKKKYEGTLCGHKVYSPEATALVPLVSSATHRAFSRDKAAAAAEQRYRRLLSGVSFNADFYFSYTLPLWLSVQRGAGGGGGAGAGGEAPFASDRVWNEYLTRPLREALGHDRWVLPLVHGFFQQRRLALFGRTLTLTLIARRSCQFAGTRYRKRGVSDAGYVANDVEIEQVVEAGLDWRTGQPLITSMVQVRGSIPLYWAQSPDVGRLKPEIILQRFDPLFTATKKHFDDLRHRYGNPIVVLNLVKLVERHPRESLLGQELAAAISHLNRQAPPGERVQYVPWDLSRQAKADSRHLLHHLQRLLAPLLRATGLFVSGASGGGGGSQQSGIVRTNCVDCLDRTNVAQFAAGLLGLGRQLHALGISESTHLDPDSSLARQLMDMYEGMGNSVAQQYGGSEAHTAFFQRQRGDWEAATQSRDVLTSIRRFYSNAYTDAEKQDAINLLLGNFVPQPGRPHLWELGSDYYLHTGRGMAGLARQIFLGASSSGDGGGSSSRAPGAVPSALPPSREGSQRGGFMLAEGSGGGGAGGMVSLSAPVGAAYVAGLGPAVSANLGALGAASQQECGGSRGEGADGGGRVLESMSGSESGRETPPLGGGQLMGGALGRVGPHLSVSTDGAEVPTLSQLVEGASPSWRPSSVGEESSLELLSLEGPPQDSALDVLGAYGLAGAVPVGACEKSEAAAGQEAGLGEKVGGAVQEQGQQVQHEQQQVEEREKEEGGEEERAQGSTTVQAEGVQGAGSGGKAAAQWQRPAPVLVASPAGEPATAAGHPEVTGEPEPRTPTTPVSQLSAASTPQSTPGGSARQRPPPTVPRKTKLESFDTLLSKPPNTVRQVRLTAVPAAPPRGSSLTAWLPSPSRPKPPSLPPAPLPQQHIRQQQQAGPGWGAAAAKGGLPSSPLGRPGATQQGACASAAQQASVAAALSRMSPHPTPALPLGPGLGGGTGAGGRLYRSSSDSTLLATVSESLESALGGLPPGISSAGRQASAYAFPPAAAAGAAPAAGAGAAGALPQATSASAADLTRYSREAGWGGGASGGRAPLVAPTGYLVVLDAWEGQGQGPGLQAAGPQGTAVSGPGLPRPSSAEPPTGRKPPRRSRFPGFSLSQGLKAFSRSKSQQAISPLTGPADGATLSPQQLQRGGGGGGPPASAAPVAPPGASATPGAATAAGLPPAWAAMYSGAPAALPMDSSGGVGSLGLAPRASAAWWVGGADPVALMLEEEARLREQYTRQLHVLATPPSPAEQQALEQHLSALTRPSWSLSMSGQAGQAAQQWRQQAGLVGAPTLGQLQMDSIAQQAQHGLAF